MTSSSMASALTDNKLMSPTEALNKDGFSDSKDALLQVYDGLSDATRDSLYDTRFARQGLVIGSLRLMISYADGSELIDMPELYHIPGTPEWFSGVINLHGAVIPVFELGCYFQVDNLHEGKKMLLVLGQGNAAAAVIIDGLPARMQWFSEQQLDTQTAPVMLRSHVKAACLIDNQLWFDLDVNSLCQSLEKSLQLN